MENTETNYTELREIQIEQYRRARLERAAFRLGFIAILSTFLVPVFLPFILGSFSIILAVISKGSSRKFSRRGKQALFLGIAAIVINIAYLLYAFTTVYSMLSTPSGREQISELLYRMYGMTLEEFLEQFGIAQ